MIVHNRAQSKDSGVSGVFSALGFSLLEVLIALALGGLLVVVATQAYSTMQQKQRVVEERTEVFAAANTAQAILRRALQAAGYVDWMAIQADGSRDWKTLLESDLAPVEARYGVAPLQVLAGSSATRQKLQVAQESTGLDCLGLAPDNQPLVQQFDIRNSAVGRQLYCKSFGKSSGALSQPLVLGIEELAFQFLQSGVWRTASEGVAPANTRAVLVCFMVAGPKHLAKPRYWDSATRPTCAPGAAGRFAADVRKRTGDSRLWERFVFVVALPNV